MFAVVLAVVVAQTCVVRDSRWEPREPVLLRFSDGQPWGLVQRSDCVGAVLAIDTTATFLPDGGAELQLERFGMNLSAHVGELPVFTRDGGDFGLGFSASPATPLSISREPDAGLVELVPGAREDVTPLQPWRPRRERCDDLRLERVAAPSWGGVQLQRETQLFDSAGRPVFRLSVGTRLEPQGGRRVRVLLDDGATISGWLRARVELPDDVSGTIHGAAICCRGVEPPPRDCSRPLRLFATNGTRTGELGTLSAATFFDVVGHDGDWVTIRPRSSFFALASGWRLVVATEELERCSELER